MIRVDLECRKRRRLENFHFSSASAPNLLDAINHVEVTVQKMVRCASKSKKFSVIAFGYRHNKKTSWIYDGQMKIKLTSQNAHDINLSDWAPKVRKADDLILSYVITAGARC